VPGEIWQEGVKQTAGHPRGRLGFRLLRGIMRGDEQRVEGLLEHGYQHGGAMQEPDEDHGGSAEQGGGRRQLGRRARRAVDVGQRAAAEQGAAGELGGQVEEMHPVGPDRPRHPDGHNGRQAPAARIGAARPVVGDDVGPDQAGHGDVGVRRKRVEWWDSPLELPHQSLRDDPATLDEPVAVGPYRSIEGLNPAHQLHVDLRGGEFEHPSLDVERMGGAEPASPGRGAGAGRHARRLITWESGGNEPGNWVGIWESDRGFLRARIAPTLAAAKRDPAGIFYSDRIMRRHPR